MTTDFVPSRCDCGGYFSGRHKPTCSGHTGESSTPTEAELLAAWEAANKVWQADVFNAEKEKALSDAAFALNLWRRVNTPEGRAYANSVPTYADETGDNEPDDDAR